LPSAIRSSSGEAAVIAFVLQRMRANAWMVLCLLAGSVLAVALITSIPVYTDGILQRLLTRDLEDFQVSQGVFSGRCELTRAFIMPDEPDRKAPLFRELDDEIGGRLASRLGVPYLVSTAQLTLDFLVVRPVGVVPGASAEGAMPFIKIEALRGFADHISLVAGRAAAADAPAGVIEAVMSEQAQQTLGLYLDGTYDIWDAFYDTGRLARVHIVGIYAPRDGQDPFWFRSLDEYGASLLVDADLLQQRFIATNAANFAGARWYLALDYHAIRIRDVPGLVARIKDAQRLAARQQVTWDLPMLGLLEQYTSRASVLQITLWFLQAPVLLMLAFFIYMVSQLIIENDANEIAVLKSRGSSSRQVFLLYLLESLFIAAAALAAGPPLGLLVCRVLGASSGFLEFVRRTSLALGLSAQAYRYALLGAALFVAAMLLPAFIASRTTIVEHKRVRGRSRRGPVWQRTFLDAVLLAVAGYGLYSYATRQKILTLTGAEGSSLPLDPLLFVISVSFILGAGMLFLRVYPAIVGAVFAAGRRRWSPVLYASFVQVGRAMGHEHFLMLFLILSLGLGVYNSVAARTINRNAEDKVRYAVGADIVIQPYWADLAPAPEEGGPGGRTPAPPGGPVRHQWVEPPFEPYRNIDGTTLATKVYLADGVIAYLGRGNTTVSLMAIVPHEFGGIAWFRPDLLPAHPNNYLNLLSDSPKALLVSSALRDEFDLHPGDPVQLAWGGNAALDGYIYAFIDYWPTFNPLVKTRDRPAAIVVANLAYLQAMLPIEPYQVWLRKAPGAQSREVFASIHEKKLPIETLVDASQEIVARRNDPMLQGTNGALTLGFIIAMGISITGFVIYWILSLKARTLQFGVLRAMGLRQARVIMMLVTEQVLISGAAIAAGILIGYLASLLFIPLLQLTSSAAAQVPPFLIVSLGADVLKIVGVAVAMLAIGAVLFRLIISRIRIHQALKLGEE
jgi:putative ABC transport system permease protein